MPGSHQHDAGCRESSERIAPDKHIVFELKDKKLQALDEGAITSMKPDDLINAENCVLVALTIYRLEGISAAACRFYAECTAHLWWYQSELSIPDEDERIEQDEWKEKGLKVPRLFFENAVSTLDSVIEPFVMLDTQGVCHMERRVRGDFHASLELAHFPYDVQMITVTLRINSKLDKKLKRYMAFNNRLVESKVQGEDDKRPYLTPNMKCAAAAMEWHTYKTAATIGLDSSNAPRMQYQAHVFVRPRRASTRAHNGRAPNATCTQLCCLSICTHLLRFGGRVVIIP